jgi:hypothetical protein
MGNIMFMYVCIYVYPYMYVFIYCKLYTYICSYVFTFIYMCVCIYSRIKSMLSLRQQLTNDRRKAAAAIRIQKENVTKVMEEVRCNASKANKMINAAMSGEIHLYICVYICVCIYIYIYMIYIDTY